MQDHDPDKCPYCEQWLFNRNTVRDPITHRRFCSDYCQRKQYELEQQERKDAHLDRRTRGW